MSFNGEFSVDVLVYAELKYSALKVEDTEGVLIAILLHFVPFPVGNTKAVMPVFVIGPETKLSEEPFELVAPMPGQEYW